MLSQILKYNFISIVNQPRVVLHTKIKDPRKKGKQNVSSTYLELHQKTGPGENLTNGERAMWPNMSHYSNALVLVFKHLIFFYFTCSGKIETTVLKLFLVTNACA